MLRKVPTVSIIIPVFNEESRIERGLTAVLSYLKKQKWQWELIIVDDGSSDATVKYAQKLLRKISSTQIVSHSQNLGKGAAIKTGVFASRGAYIVFADIDMSTPIGELPKLLAGLKNHQVAIGVRRHRKSIVLQHQPKLREFLGQCFTKLTNVLVTPEIVDVTCGFKGFQKKPAHIIFSKTRINRWAFDAEILFLAQKNNFSLSQIPVSWADDPGSKVRMFSDGIEAFADIVKIRLNNWFGNYS